EMKVGAHVSTRGHIWEAIGRAKDIDADCIQVFVSFPQRWLVPTLAEEDVQEFRRLARDQRVGPVYLHAIYLINFGTDNPELFEKSIHALASYLKAAERLDAALRKADNGIPVLIENNAGSGNCLGSRFDQIGRFIDMCHGDERLQVCIDTAHTFASGYDYPHTAEREQMFDEIRRSIGLKRVRAVHVNDSKARFGSGVDRHENLG